ncbi:MAG TPA: hypothetical protein VNQ76_20285 [Planctomicrobium sp.]|nr:hypothetical protein [Planctomicrobium sp.]
MSITSRISLVCFWISLVSVLLGGLFGLAGIWFPAVFNDEFMGRCFLSGVVLVATSMAVSGIATTWFKPETPKSPFAGPIGSRKKPSQ